MIDRLRGRLLPVTTPVRSGLLERVLRGRQLRAVSSEACKILGEVAVVAPHQILVKQYESGRSPLLRRCICRPRLATQKRRPGEAGE